MRNLFNTVILALALSGAGAFSTLAAPSKSYQVTGPVIELTDKLIVVQKGEERWEIARDEATKVTGDLKVGGKVTVYYRMTATAVETRGAAAGEKGKKK